MRVTTILFALAVGASILPAAATHCDTYSTSAPEVDTGETGAGRYYVDNDLCVVTDCFFSIWVYQESNGIEGLQRGDEVVDDTCHGMIDPDTLDL